MGLPLVDRLDPRVRAVLVAVALAVVGVGGGGVLSLLVGFGIVQSGLSLSPAVFILVALTAMQVVGLGGTALAYVRFRRVRDYVRVRIPTGRDALFVVAGYVAALGAVIVVGVVVQSLGLEPGSNQIGEVAESAPAVLLVLIPASFLVIGPFEELLFRGVVQTRLREAFGAVPAVALASLLFAAVHFVALTGGTSARLLTIGILFLPALSFGIVYELTGNLTVPALVHGAYNATLFSLLYVALRFQELAPPEALLFGV